MDTDAFGLQEITRVGQFLIAAADIVILYGNVVKYLAFCNENCAKYHFNNRENAEPIFLEPV